MTLDADVRDVLPTVRVPTLVLHQADAPDATKARLVASLHPGGRSSSRSTAPTAFRSSATRRRSSTSFGRFVARAATRCRSISDRVLATVLFTDLVGSTARAAELGDQARGV